MNEDSKNDDISEISERDTPRKNNNQKRPNNFYKKVNMAKKPVKKTDYRSRSVANDDRNKNRELNNNRYNNNKEEQKNNENKNQNLLKKSGNYTYERKNC